jgi:CubicO group peptidase (beta-lactamase class C family)
VRRGAIVSETYFGAQRAESLHPIYSITKSVVATLIGIAIQQGRLSGVDAHVVTFFGDAPIAENDPRKQAVAVEHLLTMTSGLDWGQAQDRLDPASTDLARVALDRPLAAAPGTRWRYSSSDPQILAALVRRVTGRSALEFARAELFQPLGITELVWPADAAGTSLGASGLQMRPRDLAKLGYLYLMDGMCLRREGAVEAGDGLHPPLRAGLTDVVDRAGRARTQGLRSRRWPGSGAR